MYLRTGTEVVHTGDGSAGTTHLRIMISGGALKVYGQK